MEKIKEKFSTHLSAFARQKKSSRRLWNIDDNTAGLLYFLAAAFSPSYILEIGSSNGYSTFWLALAAQKSKAQLHSIEIDEGRYKMAKDNLKMFDFINLHLAKAEEIIPSLTEGIDFVFIDAGKPAYVNYIKLLLPKLADSALIIADNIVSHPQTTASYTKFLRESSFFTNIILPLGSGLEISLYNKKGATL